MSDAISVCTEVTYGIKRGDFCCTLLKIWAGFHRVPQLGAVAWRDWVVVLICLSILVQISCFQLFRRHAHLKSNSFNNPFSKLHCCNHPCKQPMRQSNPAMHNMFLQTQLQPHNTTQSCLSSSATNLFCRYAVLSLSHTVPKPLAGSATKWFSC